MCQRIGLPPISIIGLGRLALSSEIRVPRPPASNTAFMPILTESLTLRPSAQQHEYAREDSAEHHYERSEQHRSRPDLPARRRRCVNDLERELFVAAQA